MQPMQSIFNSRMEPIQTHEDYPKYARSETKPVARARQIIDQGIISDRPCSTCVDLKQDCYRWEGTFSKCAYCTSKDRKKELCHLPGQEAAASSSQQEKRKRRKITHNIYAPSGDAASTADTTMSGTLVTGPLAPATTTPVPIAIPTSNPKSVQLPEETSTTTMTGTIHPQAAPASSEAVQAEATLERVTALENKVSSLEAKVLDLLIRLDEVSSCVGARSSSSSTSTSATARGQAQQAAAGASPSSSSSSSSPVPSNDVTFEDLQQHLPDAAAITTTSMTAPPPLPVVFADVANATREGPKLQDASSSSSSSSSPAVDFASVVVVEKEEEEEDAGRRAPGPKGQQHSIEHPEGYRPVNCSCTTGTGSGTGSRLDG